MGRKRLEDDKKEFIGFRLEKKYVDNLKEEGDLRTVIKRVLVDYVVSKKKD